MSPTAPPAATKSSGPWRRPQADPPGDGLPGALQRGEFIVLLPGIKVEKARLCAERIRTKVAAATRKIHPDKKSITVSIGASSYEKDGHTPNAQLLISLADTALHRAKRTGKNRVILARLNIINY